MRPLRNHSIHLAASGRRGPSFGEPSPGGPTARGDVNNTVPPAREGIMPFKLGCLFERARYKIIYGGRGSTKSWSVARALLIKGMNEPLRILCAREFQSSLPSSVHRLLAEQVGELQLGGF